MQQRKSNWTFLSNHAHVLICLASEPDARLRDVAERVGITERAVQTIVSTLEADGVITRSRSGRRNHYEIHRDRRFRHRVEEHCTIEDLLRMVGVDDGGATGSASGSRNGTTNLSRSDNGSAETGSVDSGGNAQQDA